MVFSDGGSAPPTSPHLPADRAFIVQFEQQAPDRHGDVGRVEHLVTGAWTRFEEWAQLEDFVGRILGTSGEPH